MHISRLSARVCDRACVCLEGGATHVCLHMSQRDIFIGWSGGKRIERIIHQVSSRWEYNRQSDVGDGNRHKAVDTCMSVTTRGARHAISE
jgi:hypothetical protein